MSDNDKFIIKRNETDIIATINLQQVKKGIKKDDVVIGETIYDVSKRKTSNWLVIALETGQRGWYPGKKENN